MSKRWPSILLAILVSAVSLVPVTGFAGDTDDQSQTQVSPIIEEILDEIMLDIPVVVDTPKNVDAKGISKSKIKVTWDEVENASGYKVYRYISSEKKYVCVKTITDREDCDYINTGLDRNTTKKYKVTAFILDEDEIAESEMSEPVKGTTKPRTIKVKAYAYSGGGTTASGKKAAKGIIAVDPSVIRLGTRVYVPGYGYAVAGDTGGAIKGKVIDVYMNTNSACIKWGVRYLTIKVYD